MGISGYEFSAALLLSEYGEPDDTELSAIENGEATDLAEQAEMQAEYTVTRANSLRNKPAKSGRAVVGLADNRELADDWQDYANCLGVDPDLFFPERGASTKEAKEVCRGCPVKEECLEFALQNVEKFGIWGGLSERERRRIRRQRSEAARSVLGA